MSGTSKGFTLLEVVIALTIIAVGFTTLIELVSVARSRLAEAEETFRDFLYLDGKIKRNDYQGLEVREEKLPDFPRIIETTYTYRDVFFVRYKVR
ncbi:prepilin-type N-terminal cleavage/methylation domain-containing protein [Hydrogenivirga caldilitoris]|uniref:Prepilin-type N-terminal cleavage/methylation domain-containing protein n=1 Tax=Hydrogenivirga caldilitoris TaxID=246264 RepID=A0A497XS07_9AQUI|nr:prepilin-type N-terminal cleavage/methylation domain-containing protein [Hydrogenivirga caldilitoris]RLJ70879.1 prepilin-type N-terminal cleavage/methylation domain-containing protein [Hydrogenivirga caldilitoris]